MLWMAIVTMHLNPVITALRQYFLVAMGMEMLYASGTNYVVGANN